MRACPAGHPIDDDRARTCPVCGSPLVPPQAAAHATGTGAAPGATSGTTSGADATAVRRERVSAPVLGLALGAVALAIGLFAAWWFLQQPPPQPLTDPSPAPAGHVVTAPAALALVREA
jgi:hypothetical protein